MADRSRRELRELTNGDALRLLGSVRFGRIVFARHALPTIRPVNHLLDGEQVIVYANLNIVAMHSDRQVVSYEADTIDHQTQLGWCVILTGTAEPVLDADEVAHYDGLVEPWLPGAQHRIVRIKPDIVTGIELIDKLEDDQD
ncbi:pyridoxamine 5'-phosphate oxidase family protein [Nocardia sp. NPDC003482]|uniref:pyridoxamine 5'-phosphate oxidase family protein n=1 Tax=Nocardia sp. NPDC004068 TaxID=3364303 RepID=UPI003683D141